MGRLWAVRCQPGESGACILGREGGGGWAEGVGGALCLPAPSVRRQLCACSPVHTQRCFPPPRCGARRVVGWWGGRGLWLHRGRSIQRDARACTPEGPNGDVDQRALLRRRVPPPAAPRSPPPLSGGSAVSRQPGAGLVVGRESGLGVMDTEARDKAVYLAKLAEQAERYDGTSVADPHGRGLTAPLRGCPASTVCESGSDVPGG